MLFCETVKDHAGAGHGLSASSGDGFTAELAHPEDASSIAELNRTDPHAWYLTEREAETLRVGNYSNWKAKMFIPCVGGRCPGRMQLHVLDKRNNPLPRAFYRCDNKQCYYNEEVIFPEDMRGSYIMEADKKRYYSSNESRSKQEMEHML